MPSSLSTVYFNFEVEASNFSYEHPVAINTGVNIKDAEAMYASDLKQEDDEEKAMQNLINGNVGRVTK